MTKEEQKFRKNSAITGIILGLALIIAGIIIFFVDASWSSFGYGLKSASFGADFYTYTYDALVQITRNTGTTAGQSVAIVSILKIFCGSFSVVAGILLMLKNIGICKFSVSLSEGINTSEHSEGSQYIGTEDAPENLYQGTKDKM